MRLIHFVYRLTPGVVKTDLNRTLDMSGIPKETIERFLKTMNPLDKVCEGLMKCIDTASRASTGGGFRDWKGDVFQW